MSGPLLFCGDPHGEFRHIIRAAGHTKAAAIIMLGDMAPEQPLHVELNPLLERKVPIWYIHGNHDADSNELWMRVWGSELADRNVHGRVVELPNGLRLAGLGGVFRKAVWFPRALNEGGNAAVFRTRSEHAKSTPQQDRWQAGPHRRHWSTIYPQDVDRLLELSADFLILHEAPGYHGAGFDLLDTLAQAIGVKVVIHGHHHDNLDSSDLWDQQGFKSFGVGLRGITAIDVDGNAEVIVPGELDEQRKSREQRMIRPGMPR